MDLFLKDLHIPNQLKKQTPVMIGQKMEFIPIETASMLSWWMKYQIAHLYIYRDVNDTDGKTVIMRTKERKD